MSQEVERLREWWLGQAVLFLSEHLATCGLTLPASGVRVSCGWPSRGGVSASARVVVGQCFASQVCKDGTVQIFVSPRLDDSIEVLGVLLHELIHAAFNNQYGHKKPFSQAARRLGLDGPPTATVVGPGLRPFLEQFVQRHGPYPHAAVHASVKAKVGSRLRLYECQCSPPFKVRVASDALSARCLRCGHVFVRNEKEGDA